MRNWVLAIALSVVSVAVAVTHADGQMINGVCKMRFVDDPSGNSELKAMMAKFRDMVSDACIDPHGKVISYASVSKVREGAQHVCVFYETTDLFPPDLRPGPRRIVTHMLIAQPDCPRQNDPRYIGVAPGVSEGVFAALVKFGDDIRKSEQAFNAAFTLVTLDSERRKRFMQMRADLLFSNGPITYEISGIGTNDFPFGSRAYSIGFRQKPYCGNLWSISVDLIPTGWNVIDFEQIKIISDFTPATECPKR